MQYKPLVTIKHIKPQTERFVYHHVMNCTASTEHSESTVTIIAPARLHLGFINLSNVHGRQFGSLGMALDQPATRLHMRRSTETTAKGSDSARAQCYAQTLLKQLGLDAGVEIRIEQAIQSHSGLGSGTQMALAVGAGVKRLFNLGLTYAEIAHRLQRGVRSGIGIAAFEQGGFLVDGGHSEHSQIPPLIARLPVPEQWCVVLLFDDVYQGVHGEIEQQAFAKLPLFTAQQAAHLSHRVLMQVLPALAEADINSFGSAISEIQRIVGNYFAPLQGGGHFTSPLIAELLEWFTANGAAGVGQSSWGPTGFAFYANQAEAEKNLATVKQRWQNTPQLRFLLTQARNRPGFVDTLVT